MLKNFPTASHKNISQSRHTESSISTNQAGFIHAQMRASILPPPDEQECYETLCPGITRTLMDTYEKQVNHRISIETTVVDSGIKNSERGQGTVEEGCYPITAWRKIALISFS